MSTQHTPGPWLARAIGTLNEPGYAVFWEDRSKSGVHTRRLDYKGCFTEADAHLIAAAPDLYEALKELYAVVKGECPSLLDEDSGGDSRLALEIESALAKAETES